MSKIITVQNKICMARVPVSVYVNVYIKLKYV